MALAIRLEPEMELKLQELAKRTQRSKSFIVRDALKAYLKVSRQKDIEKRLGKLD
jgi:predicted transcriptional regulator